MYRNIDYRSIRIDIDRLKSITTQTLHTKVKIALLEAVCADVDGALALNCRWIRSKEAVASAQLKLAVAQAENEQVAIEADAVWKVLCERFG